jgi:hypothetical protein
MSEPPARTHDLGNGSPDLGLVELAQHRVRLNSTRKHMIAVRRRRARGLLNNIGMSQVPRTTPIDACDETPYRGPDSGRGSTPCAAAGNASLAAAVVAAAYNTLLYHFPDQSAALTAKYDASLSALPDDRTKARGLAVGEAAAADLIALRADDGRNASIPTVFGMGPLQAGLWSLPFTPGSSQIAQTPWIAFMQPFMLESPSQFRAPPPPALTSAQYATDLDKTEAYGSVTGAVRTTDETNIGYFWNANVISQLNRTLRDFSTQHGMDLVDTTRLLAMGNMVATDAGIACLTRSTRISSGVRWRRFGTPTSTAIPPRRPIRRGRLCSPRRTIPMTPHSTVA